MKFFLRDKLKNFKPLKAVYGNIDGQEIRSEFPEHVIETIEGCKILMTHIAGSEGKYNHQVRALLEQEQPQLLICGHSHIAKVVHDKKFNVLYINSGAAGIHGFHKMRTILRFEIENGKPKNMELIELGLRGKIQA